MIIISFFLQNFRHIICDFFCSYFQIEIISLLSVDHDDVTLRNSSQNTLKNLLLQLENDKKNDVHSGPPMWVVDLAQSKIFETSKPTISNATVRSLSQLEPGKTITAAFIREALSQNFQLQY